MAKNAITDYSTTAASNTDVGGVDAQGSAAASNMDDLIRELMSHLAETNAGTSPWADTMTIADPVDLTKEARFDCGSITAGNTRVLTVPNYDGTIATLAGTETLTNKTLTSPALTDPNITSSSVIIQQSDDSATAGPDLRLRRVSASAAASDGIGRIIFDGSDSGGNTHAYSLIGSTITDPTDGSEDSTIEFYISKAGSLALILTLNQSAITQHTSTNTAVWSTNDDANNIIIQGGASASQGGQIFIFGDAHATAASDIAFFSDNVQKYRYDASESRHKFTDTVGSGTFSETGATAGTDMTAGQFNMSKTGTGSNSMVGFYNANGLIGSITTSGSATAYNTSSDQRLKKNFRAAPAAGARIDQIKIHEYDWRGGGTGIGPKAQELHEVFPEAVTPGEGEPGEPGFRPWGWDASKLVPFLVLEIQSLRQRVAALETTRQT